MVEKSQVRYREEDKKLTEFYRTTVAEHCPGFHMDVGGHRPLKNHYTRNGPIKTSVFFPITTIDQGITESSILRIYWSILGSAWHL